jgi:hypothetical protein
MASRRRPNFSSQIRQVTGQNDRAASPCYKSPPIFSIVRTEIPPRWWCAVGNVVTRAEVADHDLIMLDYQFAGSVLISGQPRRLNINGNPMGRTVIQVDGVTVYDKKPFVQKEVIDFQVIPAGDTGQIGKDALAPSVAAEDGV